jgi:hypothetical protein
MENKIHVWSIWSHQPENSRNGEYPILFH